MANSNITKKALANSLKECLLTKSFEKITIEDICNKCEMNRKSFYYHFKDKYSLVEYIFNSEFKSLHVYTKKDSNIFKELCIYLYDNKDFYTKILKYEGQNNFQDYLEQTIFTIVIDEIADLFLNNKYMEFGINFLIDAFTCAIVRWILKPDPIPADEFFDLLNRSIFGIAKAIIENK